MKHLISISIIILIVSVFFSPLWINQKVALNGNFLVSFYAPWKFDTFTGYPAGVPAKQGGGYDQIRIGFPYFAQVWDAWRHLRIPLWNPYNFSGLPLLAETQSAAFYPLQFFAFFLPDAALWNIFVVSGFFLAFLFTYLFLHEVTDTELGSLLGGFTFAFSSFFIVWTQEVIMAQHAALWLPLALLAIRKLCKNKSWWIILLLAFVLSILSGYMQVTIYVVATCVLYSFWLKREGGKITVSNVLVCIGLALSLTAFQLLPLYEMNSYSSRNIVDTKSFL